MKIKKIIPLVIAVSIVLSVLLSGAISASAEEPVLGGWQFSDIAADNVSSEEAVILHSALEGMAGECDYTAKDVIATQVVAGTNYAFLCLTSPNSGEPESFWTIVTVYVDFEGNSKLVKIQQLDPSDVKVKDNVGDSESGSWKSTAKENAAPVSDSISSALSSNIGLSLSPIAVLGTQVVNGTNYCILAYGTLVTATPRTDLYKVEVNESNEGVAEITSVLPFDLEAYVTEEAIEDPTIGPAGGWAFSDIAADSVTDDEKAVFEKAVFGISGSDFVPKDVIAAQVVAGTKYAFLCITTPVIPDAQPHWAIVTIYADLAGNASIENVADIDPADVKILENLSDNTSGGWFSTAKETAAPVSENIKSALDENIGVALSSIAVLGTQPVAGKNYRILAYGSLVSAEPRTDLYVVTVYEDISGNAEITSIAPFDIAAYVEKPVEEPTEESSEVVSDEPRSSAQPESSAGNSGNGSTSPQTGSNDPIVFAVILMILAGSVFVTVYSMKKTGTTKSASLQQRSE